MTKVNGYFRRLVSYYTFNRGKSEKQVKDSTQMSERASKIKNEKKTQNCEGLIPPNSFQKQEKRREFYTQNFIS